MIGGLKFISRAALVAAAVSMGGVAAQAADLGGNCCADLEERVAELEATTARKGNRKVSLEVSGHVHQGIMFWDDGYSETNAYIGTPNTSRSRFRFKGKASINADWEAGFLMEFGVRQRHLQSMSQNDADTTTSAGIDIRHEALYIKSKTYGSVWFGWTGEAIEGITEINLGGTLTNSPDPQLSGASDILLELNGTGVRSTVDIGETIGAAGEQAGEGNRVNMIKYTSPTILLASSLSASWGEDDAWSVALRYAGEFGPIRVAAGVGYKESADGENGLTEEYSQFGTSGSIMHTPTGLYLTGQYGENEDDVSGETDSNWFVTAGIKQKFFAIGADEHLRKVRRLRA